MYITIALLVMRRALSRGKTNKAGRGPTDLGAPVSRQRAIPKALMRTCKGLLFVIMVGVCRNGRRKAEGEEASGHHCCCCFYPLFF